MRVLFLHATWHRASEYNVHQLLANHVDMQKIEPYFIWQDSTVPYAQGTASTGDAQAISYWDFGRDMAISPKPPKPRRAGMMLLRLPTSLRFMVQKVRAIKPDVIYTSQQFYEVLLAHLLSRWFGIPHVIHISYPVGPWLGRLTMNILRRSKHLIACSEYVRQSALDAGIAPAQIKTLLHGADLQEYAIPKHRAALQGLVDWDEQAPVVIAAARLDRFKGYELLLQAFAQVQQQMPEARLLICGEATVGTSHDRVIKQMVTELGLTQVVHFTGFRQDLAQLLAASDVFCLPTENDALPLVFLAAMAAGLPTVACHSGGVPEMVLDGKTGLLSELGNAEALAHNLLRLLQNQQLAQGMGAAGKQRALIHFHPRRIAQQWTQMIHTWFGQQTNLPFGERSVTRTMLTVLILLQLVPFLLETCG